MASYAYNYDDYDPWQLAPPSSKPVADYTRQEDEWDPAALLDPLWFVLQEE